jgi:uncharacterized protein (DUF2384 family)
MPDIDEDDSAAPSSAAPARRGRPRWSDRPKLAPDAAGRQGRVTKLALEAFGGKDEAIAYLNADSGKLGGRPLDVAIASAEGLLRVERDLDQKMS